jgi:Tfp pilus assembly protein FimV
MVVKPAKDLGDEVTSYRVGRDGPPPELAAEVLSKRSAQQQDMTNKPDVYSFIGVAEFILIDVTGKFLPQRLLLKRLEKDGSWTDLQDADGGVTSRLGFCLRIDDDARLRVVNRETGQAYPRPDEAERERLARQDAEARLADQEAGRKDAESRLADAQEQLKTLQAEIERLRKSP